MTESTPRAAVYARKSTEDPKRPGKSVRDQVREARAEVDRRGYLLDEAHVYVDDGISASRHAHGKARPGYLSLMAAIEASDIDVLVMAEQSRLDRVAGRLLAVFDLCRERQVRLVLGGRDVNPEDPNDKMVVGITAIVDEAEADRARVRTLRGVRAAAASGRPAGKNMYGYARVYDPAKGELLAVDVVPEEAAIVREVVERILRGDPLNVITRDLNDRGVPSPYDAVAARVGRPTKGARWVATQVRRIALSPAYAGIRVHKGDTHAAIWPPVVTEAEHARCVAILRAPERRTNGKVRPGSVVHWLSGVAECGECGRRMRVLTNRGTYRTYVCHHEGCRKVTRAADPLERYVEAFVLRVATQHDLLAQLAARRDDTATRDAADALATFTARREEVRGLIVAGSLPAADGAAILADLGDRIADAERTARSLVVPRDLGDLLGDDLVDGWDDLIPARKREVAAALLHVRVESMHGRKSRTFLPEYVDVHLRGSRECCA